MNYPQVVIQLDHADRGFVPGQSLSGEYRVEGIERDDVTAIELSVLWHTEGKGDEDLAVHQFERVSADEGDWIDPGRPTRFQTVLPNSPLSYDGVIVKIRWCVRVRVSVRRGKDLIGEEPFLLGDVKPAEEVS